MNEQSSLFPSLPEGRSVTPKTPTQEHTLRVLMAQRKQIVRRELRVVICDFWFMEWRI